MGDVVFTLVPRLPKIAIDDGMVYISGGCVALACTPALLRKFCETGRRQLDQWEADRTAPLLFKKPG